MLKDRQARILLLMEDHKTYFTGKEIAKYMNVTDRTIRSDIEEINHYFNTILIEANKRYGYRVNHNAFLHLDIEKSNEIPQESIERCSYIIRDLLFHRGDINLLDIQNELYVSNYSIDADLKKIKKTLTQYNGLELIRSKNFIHLEGSEEEKRILYKDMLKTETQGNFLNLNKLASFYKDFDLIKVKDILEKVLNKNDYLIQEMLFPMLMMHIGISIERILHHNYISETSHLVEVEHTIEYKIAKEFYIQVAKEIRLEVVESEIILLTFLIMGKRSIDYTEDLLKLTNANYNLSTLVKEILLDLKQFYDIDLTHDYVLEVGLQAHILALIERTKKHMEVPNVYLQEIKRKYPLVFEMGIRVSKVMEDKLNIILNEDEIGFIALHLGSAYERSNLNCNYRAVLIYPQDQVFSNVCIDKINARFHDRMEIVGSINFYEMSAIEEMEPDLILTTLPLHHDLKIMTVQISMFVNFEDESHIFQALNLLDKKRFHDQFALKISNLIEPRFFTTDYHGETTEEVIAYMCHKLESAHYINKDFLPSIMKREEMSSTSFVYGFAIPHTLNVASIHSNISIAILHDAIPWGDFKVKLVIMLAINEDDTKIMRMFFDWLSSMVEDSEQLTKLLTAKNCDEFIHLILDEGEIE
ncbi:MAG: PTS sugar transporter subunit IIA [Erysipelotrichaceae bacterium]